MELARAWTAFGGASLALMGASVACGARRYAADNLAWRRQWSQAVGAAEPAAGEGAPRLIRIYRAGGTLCAGAGAGLAAAALLGRLASRVPPGDPRPVGAGLILLGLGLGAQKIRGGAAALRPDERAAGLALWTLYALWAGFGLKLFLGAPR